MCSVIYGRTTAAGGRQRGRAGRCRRRLTLRLHTQWCHDVTVTGGERGGGEVAQRVALGSGRRAQQPALRLARRRHPLAAAARHNLSHDVSSVTRVIGARHVNDDDVVCGGGGGVGGKLAAAVVTQRRELVDCGAVGGDGRCLVSARRTVGGGGVSSGGGRAVVVQTVRVTQPHGREVECSCTGVVRAVQTALVV